MRVQKYLSSLTLMAAMLVGTMAFAAPQQGRQDGRHGDDDRDHKTTRYYDRHHRDYHEWNERENHAYSRWETDRHKAHREFKERRNSDQSRYWAWRHSHPDND